MTYVLAIALVVVIVAAQWFFTSRALRSPSSFIGWVTGGYAAKIALLAIGLYVPRALGVAAIATIIAIIVSSTVEMIVMMRKRTMNVDAPSDTQ